MMIEGDRNGEARKSKKCGENPNLIIRIPKIQVCVCMHLHVCVCACVCILFNLIRYLESLK